MNILWVSDGGHTPTGFGRVAREVCSRLSKEYGFDVYQLSLQYQGQPLPELEISGSFECDECGRDNDVELINEEFYKRLFSYVTLQNTSGRDFGAKTIPKYVEMYDIDTVISLSDPWTVQLYKRIETPYLVSYMTLDTEEPPKEFAEYLGVADTNVFMTDFARDAIEDAFGVSTKSIYHGVNSDVFKPVEVEDFRKEMGELLDTDLENKFVAGIVARNTQRKRMDRLLSAWSKFSEDKDDVVLILHTDPNDPYESAQGIRSLIELKGVKDTTYISPLIVNFNQGTSDERLNKLYNLFDVQVTSTGGEGFGLPIAEMMATKGVNIATNYTSPPELLGRSEERGLLADVSDYYWYSDHNIKRALVDIDDLANKIQWAYDNRDSKAFRQKENRARRFVENNLEWSDEILPQWEDVIYGGSVL